MVDLLDWDALRAAGPKVFVGFSDITVLHEAFAARARARPPCTGRWSRASTSSRTTPTQEHLRRTLFAPETVRTLGLADGRGRWCRAGPAGVTLGGCLACSPPTSAPRTPGRRRAGGLLLLEDVGEAPYRLDRYLTQLLRAGWLDGVAGIVLGSWAALRARTSEVRAVLVDRLGGLGVPVVEEFGFGHGDGALTMPLGVPAELDADGRHADVRGTGDA